MKNAFGRVLSPCLLGITLFVTYSLAFADDDNRPLHSRIQIDRLGVDDGLPDGTIFSMRKDHRGFLWLGTPRGLVRFDGSQVEVFRNDNTAPLRIHSQSAGNIHIDRHQRIWVGSWGEGLFVYDKNLTLLYHFHQDAQGLRHLGSNLVQTIFGDSQGNIWIGTNGAGAALFTQADQPLQHFNSRQSEAHYLAHDRIWHFAEHPSNGQIWIGSGDGLYALSPDSSHQAVRLEVELSDTSEQVDLVRVIRFAHPNEVWLGLQTSVCRYLPDSKRCEPAQLPDPDSDPMAAVTSLELTDDNQLWIGTQRGIYLYDLTEKTFLPLLPKGQLVLFSHDDIRDIHQDDSGALWLATRPSGLIKLTFPNDTFESFTHFHVTDDESSPIGRVQALLADYDNNLWVGANDQLLLLRHDSSDVTAFATVDELGIGNIVQIYQTRDHTIWLGGSGGLLRKTAGQANFENMNDLFAPQKRVSIEYLLEDDSGVLWVGTTHHGLFRYQQNQMTPHRLSIDGMSMDDKAVTALAEHQSGSLLAGVSGFGILRLSTSIEDVLNYRATGSQDSLSNNDVNQIYKSRDGTIWVATNNKLNRLDEVANTFEHFGEDNGLANTNIKSILEDDNGDIWVSTAQGLYRMDQDTHNFVYYAQQHGLHGNDFIARVSAKDQLGRLYFGGMEGFSRVLPGTLDLSGRVPEVVIRAVEVNQRRLPQLDFSDPFDHLFDSDVTSITFDVSDLNFLLPGNSDFVYRLKGNNDSWSSPSPLSNMGFSGLRPGFYRFEVKAVNDGVYSEGSAIFNFEIGPPWWQSSWFFFLLILLLGIVIHTWNRWRLATLSKENEALEQQVSSRTEELVLAKSQLIESEKNASLSSLVTGVAHEINTPLGISITAASVLNEKATNLKRKLDTNSIKRSELEEVLQYLLESADMVDSNLGRVSKLVNRFKQLSVDQISHQQRQFELKGYLEEIFSGLQPMLDQHRVKLELVCEQSYWVDSFPGAIAQMLTQLAKNAIDHAFLTSGERVLQLQVEVREDHCIHMHFKDNGCGMDDATVAKIFEPFFTTQRQSGRTGLGLQIVANIVTLRLQGKIHCVSEPGKGTCFDIEFPANLTPSHEKTSD